MPYVWPPKWEAGHAAWFVADRVLERALGEPPPLPYGRSLFDSVAVARGARWDLPLPTKDETLAYLRTAHDLVTARLRRAGANARLRCYARFALLHEDMHAETMVYTRQTLGYPAPRPSWPLLPRRPPQGPPAPRRATPGFRAARICWASPAGRRSPSTTSSGRTRWRFAPSPSPARR